MREIKFRAWHKERQKMLSVFDINFRTPATVQVLNDKYELYNELFDCVEIMQFTGLKDCNGVDIYEGDICEIEYSVLERLPWNKEEKLIGAVQCIDGSFLVGNRKRGDFLFQEISTVKVIGNIYQNPELLGVQK